MIWGKRCERPNFDLLDGIDNPTHGRPGKNNCRAECQYFYRLRYNWIHQAADYNHSYADSGIFCIHASCHPTHLRELVEIVCMELVAMEGSVNMVEFNRYGRNFLSVCQCVFLSVYLFFLSFLSFLFFL